MFTEIFTISLQRIYVSIIVNKRIYVERIYNLLDDTCHICQLPNHNHPSNGWFDQGL